MSKKPIEPSVADANAAPGGVAAVDRAFSLLGAFKKGDVSLGLIDLSERTKLYKSTILRLIASLEHSRLIVRNVDATYSLGPEVMRLHAVYTNTFSLEAQVTPVLKKLVGLTRESAAFHVLRDGARLCLHRVDSPQVVRDHIKAGDLLPLNRGAGGRVLSGSTMRFASRASLS
jgi:DNA-binding IclR family transcriptional regulator